MLDRLVNNIDTHQLFSAGDNLLLGVSGGIDSVVLVDLLHEAGFAFAIAHCNFKLRGEDSDQDELFVRSLAAKYGKTYFSQSFETSEIATDHGISIEMAARELRYTWFEEIRKNHHFDWIVIAHHRDDQIETFFLNLARGTGISGLTGMKSVSGKIVRPMLFASRNEIEQYATVRKLGFRDDISNLSTDFQRNKIRHLILPLMEELNPSFRYNMVKTIAHLRDTATIFSQSVERAAEMVVRRTSKGTVELSIPDLKLLHPIEAYLFELIKPFHFKGELISAMVRAIDGQSGKVFYSATHRAVVNRDSILINEQKENSDHRYYLNEGCSIIEEPIHLTISNVKCRDLTGLNRSFSIAYLDLDKLLFPLILRKWQPGDYFQPLGMTGMKKLSDFFVDLKLSIPDKENVWILTSGDDIVWIVGIRLDNRYKITATTENALVIEYF